MEYILTALSSTTATALLLWIFRKWITIRLTESIRYEYKTQIELLKAGLVAGEAEIKALRDSALTGISHRQKILYERKIKAVDDVWSNLIALAPAKMSSTALSSINYKNALKAVEHNKEAREFFKLIDKDSERNYLKINLAISSRPFISELAWALFSAYSSILSIAIIRIETLKIGISEDYTAASSILTVVQTALPGYEKYIQEHKIDGLHYLLEILETKILEELKLVLDDHSSDSKSIKRAAEILEATKSLINKN